MAAVSRRFVVAPTVARIALRFGDNDYQLNVTGGFSHVVGSEPAMRRLQSSSARWS